MKNLSKTSPLLVDRIRRQIRSTPYPITKEPDAISFVKAAYEVRQALAKLESVCAFFSPSLLEQIERMKGLVPEDGPQEVTEPQPQSRMTAEGTESRSSVEQTPPLPPQMPSDFSRKSGFAAAPPKIWTPPKKLNSRKTT